MVDHTLAKPEYIKRYVHGKRNTFCLPLGAQGVGVVNSGEARAQRVKNRCVGP